jgi:hypothetical protein
MCYSSVNAGDVSIAARPRRSGVEADHEPEASASTTIARTTHVLIAAARTDRVPVDATVASLLYGRAIVTAALRGDMHFRTSTTS